MKTIYILISICIFSYSVVNAQAVGIGTTVPNASAILDVESSTKGILVPRMANRSAVSSPVAGLIVYETDTKLLYQHDGTAWRKMLNSTFWNSSDTRAYVFNTTDSIGIGTSVPAEKLHISNGQIRLSRSSSFDNSIIFNMPSAQVVSEHEGLKFQLAGVDKGFIGYSSNSLSPSTVRLSGNGLFSQDLTINSAGDVGIGTNGQTEKLQVAGNALISNGGILYLAKSTGLKTVEIKSTESGSDGASMLLYNNAGLVTIEIDADYGDGDGRVITSELQIKGGSDLAENFDITNAEESEAMPGMLVSIDIKNEGKLCITSQPGDKRVVGVISGANGIKPGMLMGQQGSIAYGKHPIALAGRVYVLTNSEGGEINPGDFLTSSSQKGYAKKVENIAGAQGALIGKAMGSADPKTGFVLCLINLQ